MTDAPHEPDHDRLRRMISLPATRDDVWAAIGGFDRIADWHPLITHVELSEIDGASYRHLFTTEAGRFFERLIEAGPHHMTYEIVEAPFAIADCRATLACVAEPGGCHVFWSARFVPADDQGHLTDKMVAAYFEAGLEALAERFAAA